MSTTRPARGPGAATTEAPAPGAAQAVAQPALLRRLRLADVAAGDAAARHDHDALVRRGAVPDARVREHARTTLADVRARGDAAVREANASVGGGRPDGRLVFEAVDLREARDRLVPRVRRALDQAIANVRRFAETQQPASSRTTISPGIEIERRWTPLASVGAYVPGGSAPYPSSLVMTVVPARVAGVERVVVASPADRDGQTNPVLLGAAGLLEVEQFIIAGGAQAIGALAYGLPEAGVGPVDRIVGPGNAWVTAAKIEVCGEVGIDLPAGPSEGMVLAAPPANPWRVAADLITQAEHGPDSPAILVTTDAIFADAVEAAVAAQLARASRHEILEAALRDHGRIVIAPDLARAIARARTSDADHRGAAGRLYGPGWLCARDRCEACAARHRIRAFGQSPGRYPCRDISRNPRGILLDSLRRPHARDAAGRVA